MYQLRNKINRTNVPKHPKSNFNACDDFLETIIVGHILSAALSTLKLGDINDQLSGKGFGVSSLENLWTYTDEERRAVLHSISTTIVENFVWFSFNAPPDVAMREDGIHNYACQLLSIGLFYLSYKDAIREGDGQRVLECWHYLLPVFHNSGRSPMKLFTCSANITMICHRNRHSNCCIADLLIPKGLGEGIFLSIYTRSTSIDFARTV